MPAPTQHRCEACDILIQSADIKSHKKSQRHVEVSKRKRLYCHQCNKAFLDRGGFTDHNESRHEHQPIAGRVFCVPCNFVVKPKDAQKHRLLKKHIKRSKTKGLYCNVCERAFMCNTGLHSHQDGKVHKANERNSGPRSTQVVATEASVGMKFCGICGVEYYAAKKDHIREQPHIDACKEKGLHCKECESIFPTNRLRHSHSCPNHNSPLPSAVRSADEPSLPAQVTGVAGTRDSDL
ncbi:hypothetical protein K440DRAFT_639285 [Wilcoxina mikolae CBS 423.85]|nr:hypothetical protein K440DRAFT_639285 [Wilcoxina mikolae CBS 423.85]